MYGWPTVYPFTCGMSSPVYAILIHLHCVPQQFEEGEEELGSPGGWTYGGVCAAAGAGANGSERGRAPSPRRCGCRGRSLVSSAFSLPGRERVRFPGLMGYWYFGDCSVGWPVAWRGLCPRRDLTVKGASLPRGLPEMSVDCGCFVS